MKKYFLTCLAPALALVVLLIAVFGNKIRYCSCGALYNIQTVAWGYMPIHYHLKGDDWNKLRESPASYFKEETKINEKGEEAAVEGSYIFCGYAGGDVKVPKTINGKAVKRVSFAGAWNVTGVYLPDSVTTIPEYCFAVPKYGTAFDDLCIEKVYIPSSVTEIGSHAFSETNLKSISVPDSVTEIGESAFNNCANLTSATLSNSLTEINKSVFSGCTGLTNITIPDSVTEIRPQAFANCTNLSNITIPDSVTHINRLDPSMTDTTGFLNAAGNKINLKETAFYGCENIQATYKGKTYDYEHINDLYAAING